MKRHVHGVIVEKFIADLRDANSTLETDGCHSAKSAMENM